VTGAAGANGEHPAAADLGRECARFSRYLIGRSADASVEAKYAAAHEARSELAGPPGRLDRALERCCRAGTPGIRAADCYTRLFAPSARLRVKLVLLVAILESYGPTFDAFETPNVRGRGGFAVGLAARGILFGVGVLAGLLIVGPAHAYSVIFERPDVLDA